MMIELEEKNEELSGHLEIWGVRKGISYLFSSFHCLVFLMFNIFAVPRLASISSSPISTLSHSPDFYVDIIFLRLCLCETKTSGGERKAKLQIARREKDEMKRNSIELKSLLSLCFEFNVCCRRKCR